MSSRNIKPSGIDKGMGVTSSGQPIQARYPIRIGKYRCRIAGHTTRLDGTRVPVYRDSLDEQMVITMCDGSALRLPHGEFAIC